MAFCARRIDFTQPGIHFFGLLLCREARASGGDPAMAEQIQQRMETAMAKYLTIKAALLEPETLRLMMEMTSATCDLLVQVGRKTFVLFCPEENCLRYCKSDLKIVTA